MLAYELKKDVSEILSMDLDEYVTWLAFFKIVNDSNKLKTSGGSNGYKPR